MRFLLIAVILALLLALLGFAVTNLETRTTVTLWQSSYPDVPVWSIVFLSALAGIVSVGIIGVVDGAAVRLRNRQMARELRRLETELNFLRTQPQIGRREPDVAGDLESVTGATLTVAPPRIVESDPVLASAPVYRSDDLDDPDDDDPYTGGRAV